MPLSARVGWSVEPAVGKKENTCLLHFIQPKWLSVDVGWCRIHLLPIILDCLLQFLHTDYSVPNHRVLVWQPFSGLVPWYDYSSNSFIYWNPCLKKITKSNWGIDEWSGGTLPAEKYEYCCSMPTDFWEPLEDAQDESVQDILKWFYHAKVLKLPGLDIVFQEELRYIVQTSELGTEGEWSTKITVFDVRCQQDRVFSFRLRKWSVMTNPARCAKKKNITLRSNSCFFRSVSLIARVGNGETHEASKALVQRNHVWPCLMCIL